MVLAEFDTINAAFLKEAMVFIAAVAITAYYVKGLFWGEKTPQPLEVRENKAFATQAEVNALTARNQVEHDNIFSKLGGVERGLKKEFDQKVSDLSSDLVEMERRINKEDEDRTSKLHGRLNEILEVVGELRGTMGLKKKG